MLYLIMFVNTIGRLSLRKAELQTLLDLNGVGAAEMRWSREGDKDGKECVFMEIDLPSEDIAKRVAERSVNIKAIFEPWGRGKTPEECWKQVTAYPETRKEPYLREGSTFKINSLSYGGKIDEAASKRMIEQSFNHVEFKGKVLMDRTKKGVKKGAGRAENQFWYLEDCLMTEGEEVGKGTVTGALKSVWFAREVSIGGRELLLDYDLKKRDYLCSTTMTAENSFLVANFAHAVPGKLILDPFCGSASLLVSVAHFGAHTMGGDIDIRVIRGKERDKKLVSHCRFARRVEDVQIGPLDNFKQYNLEPPLGLVRCDNAKPVWRSPSLFDAIVCDPPYGVRAGARKTGTTKEAKPIPEELREGHIPGTVNYDIADVMKDLLDMAARYLAVGGRLVFWLPTTNDYKEEDLPQHPALKMVHNCEEQVTMRWQRRLITMQKLREPAEGEKARCELQEQGEEVAHENFSEKYFMDESRRVSHESRRAKKLAKASMNSGKRKQGSEDSEPQASDGAKESQAATEGGI